MYSIIITECNIIQLVVAKRGVVCTGGGNSDTSHNHSSALFTMLSILIVTVCDLVKCVSYYIYIYNIHMIYVMHSYVYYANYMQYAFEYILFKYYIICFKANNKLRG